MDRDIEFVHPQSHQHMVFPAWRLFNKENARALKQVHDNDNFLTPQDPGYDSPEYEPYGWTMPHLRFSEVNAMLQAVTKGQGRYAAMLAPQGAGPAAGNAAALNLFTSSTMLCAGRDRSLPLQALGAIRKGAVCSRRPLSW